MACHLRGLGLLAEPIRLMHKVRGLQFVPLERYDECCGFGGSFAVRYPEISGAMVTDKAEFIEKAGVDAVVATDPGSVRDFQAFARQTGNELLEQTSGGEEFVHYLRRR